MENKLCNDYDNSSRCDFDCRKCANLVYDAMTDENKNLMTEKDRFQLLFQIKSKENAELIDKCQELEKKNAWLEKECEKLRDDNQRLAHECRYYIDLLYRKGQLGQLMKKSDPVIFQHAYGELSDKIESLNEDIIRLDKCLSNRQCVQLERIKEEDHA